MKKVIRLICGIVIVALMAISVFVPVTVSATGYTVPEDAKFITDLTAGRILAGIAPGATVSDLETMFTGCTLTVKNTSNTTVTSDSKIGTGFNVAVSFNGSTVDTFTTIVYGDINGDGIIDSTDSVVITQSIIGNSTLERINFLAADITLDKKSNATDLLNMSMHMLGIKAISQTASSEVKELGKKVRIVTIGDSITEGMGTYNSYRTQLAMNLYDAGANIEFVGPRTNYDPRVSAQYRKHAGWSGYFVGPTSTSEGNTDGIYQQLVNIFPYDSEGKVQDIADIGLMMIGHNNYFRNVALVDENGRHIFEDEYKNLVREIFKRQPNLTLYCATMINQDNGHSPDYNYQDGGILNKNYGFTYDEAQNANLHNWVADLVEEGYDVRYFDLCNATNLSGANGDFDSDDGTHPNEVGQAKMGDAWFERIVDDVLARNNAESSGETEIKVDSVTFDKTELTLYQGYNGFIKVTTSPENADFNGVVWASSNKSVATVDTCGNIKALTPGVTTITATSLSGNMSAVCTVTVIEDPTLKEMPVNIFSSNFAIADRELFSENSDVHLFKGDIYLDGHGCYLSTPVKYDLGNKWSASITQSCTINFATSYGERYYTELIVGNLRAKIFDCNKLYKLYYDGKEIASSTSEYDTDRCTFTLRYDNGKVMIIKESLISGAKSIMLEAEVPNESYYAAYEIWNYEIWRSCLMTGCSLNIYK